MLKNPKVHNDMDSKSSSRKLTHDHYGVGWVCALPKEHTAARAMLDEEHFRLPKPQDDPNIYTLGSIGDHNIVIICLPKGKIGTNSATFAVAQMVRTFPSIRVGLMVGIGGGNPFNEVRLGDVVISAPIDQYPGVVQWDMGKAEDNGIFKRTGALNNSPTALLTAVSKLESDHEMYGSQILDFLNDLKERYPRLASKYTWSASLKDPLATQSSTANSITGLVSLDLNETGSEPEDVRVHYGLIASGNQVVKDVGVRDKLNKSLGGHVLCFEMEAAGLMDNFPCIVIRGICDYADAQKNKVWQEYAAAVAAACARELLGCVQPSDVSRERPMKDILDGVNKSVQLTEKNVERIKSTIDKKEDLKVLDWLTKVDYGPQQSDFLRMREPGTCKWFLDCCQYQEWRSLSQQTLFCPGDPGVGKTILVATVVDDLTKSHSDNQMVGLAYIYCNFKRQDEQHVEDLLASLAKQLSQGQPLPDSLSNLHDLHSSKRTRPSLEEISQTLISVAAMYSKVFIVVDALDECQASDGCMPTFLNKLFTLQIQTMTSLLVTARRMPEIEMRFEGCISQPISASEGDIRSYLDTHMTRLPRFVQESPQLKEDIKINIIAAVKGIFLLARLHLDSLVGMRAPKAIRIALKKLPHGSNAYDSAYEEAMQRILGQVPSSRELAEQTLAWISRAKRQLSVSELQYALAVEVGESELDEENISQVADILSVCAGLVTVDEESRIIRLVHYTTQEYFQRKRQVWFRDPEADITQICVTYLLFQSGPCLTRKEFEERLTLNPFYDYAARNWGHHARESSVLSSEVNDFLNCKVKIEASSQAIEDRAWDLLKDPQTTGLHLATYFGLEEAVKSMLEHGADIDSRDSYGGTSLLWAARYGRETVVNLLIERNAHLEMKDRFGQTPLSRAAGSDNKRVAELLLENGADLESKDKYGRSPLSTAARDGNETAVKLLLEKGADLQSKDRYDLTPLSWAARYGFEAVVQLLLDGGAILDSIDHFGRTPLSWAVESGYGAVVEVLLDKGADLNLKDHSGRTPLSWITEDECKAVLKLLLDRKADLESRDDSGRTPLSWAAENTSEAVVEELLDNGAELESEDHAGRTPLWWAARWANMTVVERLLEKGALMHDDETKVAVSECLEYGNYNES